MVDVQTDFPLQRFVERHDCRYFTENALGNSETLNLALRSPFARLYTIDRSRPVVAHARARFQDNDRVQVFLWTTANSWVEVVRLVPAELPAVFWLHATENISRGIRSIARLRPLRHDVLIVEKSRQRGIVYLLEQHFGRTHVLEREHPEFYAVAPTH